MFMQPGEFIDIKRIGKLYKMEKDESGTYKHTGEIEVIRIGKRIFKRDMLNIIPVNNTTNPE